MIPPERVADYLSELGPYFAVACEAQVIDFSRRTHYGPWIKVRVEHIEQLAGVEQGQRYQLLMVRLGDDEMPASNEHKPYRLSQKAAMLCSQPEFWAWITEEYGDPCVDKDAAANWVRQACGVESRSMLDTNQVAAEIFWNIMRQYDEWRKAAE